MPIHHFLHKNKRAVANNETAAMIAAPIFRSAKETEETNLQKQKKINYGKVST